MPFSVTEVTFMVPLGVAQTSKIIYLASIITEYSTRMRFCGGFLSSFFATVNHKMWVVLK